MKYSLAEPKLIYRNDSFTMASPPTSSYTAASRFIDNDILRTALLEICLPIRGIDSRTGKQTWVPRLLTALIAVSPTIKYELLNRILPVTLAMQDNDFLSALEKAIPTKKVPATIGNAALKIIFKKEDVRINSLVKYAVM